MATRPLDRLPPESRAVLSLILLQSRSYNDIAALLRLSEDDVRDRAHVAAKHLVDSGSHPDAHLQERIIDYLLGEQTVSQRADTRTTLEADPVARAWAGQLVHGLSPLATDELPAVPGEPADEHDPVNGHEVPTEHDPVDTGELRPSNEGTILFESARHVTETRSPEPASSRMALPPVRLLVPVLAMLATALVIVLIVTAGGGGGAGGASTRGSVHLALTATAADPGAGGTATVSRQADGFRLQIRAHGVAPNTHRNSYAVWLYNSAAEAVLIGFVSPQVGRSGTFENSGSLPEDAPRFHTLAVSLETVAQPSSPGPILLRAPLRVP